MALVGRRLVCLSIREQLATFDLGSGEVYGGDTFVLAMGSATTTAAVTLSLTGPFVQQGRQAVAGLELWAEEAGVGLTVVDDGGSRLTALQAYAAWLHQGVDLLLGPYGSGLVRAVAPLVCDGGRLLYNHGGSADDLGGPGWCRFQRRRRATSRVLCRRR